MSAHIIPVRLSFMLPIGPDKSVERFVHAYVILGERIGFVDTGAAGYQQGLVDALATMRKAPSDVAWVVNTHEHPDHIGGNGFFAEQGKPSFACHTRAVRWIEDLNLQFQERPIFDFFKLTGKSICVERRLEDGDEIDLGGVTLRVIFTPGHSPGSISLYCPQDGALITADAIQPVGGLPLYANLEESRASMRRLLALPGVQTLYCAHASRTFTGSEISATIRSGLDYLDRVDAAVKSVVQQLPGDAGAEEITRETLLRLGMAPPPVLPITMQSIMAHLR